MSSLMVYISESFIGNDKVENIYALLVRMIFKKIDNIKLTWYKKNRHWKTTSCKVKSKIYTKKSLSYEKEEEEWKIQKKVWFCFFTYLKVCQLGNVYEKIQFLWGLNIENFQSFLVFRIEKDSLNFVGFNTWFDFRSENSTHINIFKLNKFLSCSFVAFLLKINKQKLIHGKKEIIKCLNEHSMWR
jgi:hypothetical protein